AQNTRPAVGGRFQSGNNPLRLISDCAVGGPDHQDIDILRDAEGSTCGDRGDVRAVPEGIRIDRTASVSRHVDDGRAIPSIEADELLVPRIQTQIEKHDHGVDHTRYAARSIEGIEAVSNRASLVDAIQAPVVTASGCLRGRPEVMGRIGVVAGNGLGAGRGNRPSDQRSPRIAVQAVAAPDRRGDQIIRLPHETLLYALHPRMRGELLGIFFGGLHHETAKRPIPDFFDRYPISLRQAGGRVGDRGQRGSLGSYAELGGAFAKNHDVLARDAVFRRFSEGARSQARNADDGGEKKDENDSFHLLSPLTAPLLIATLAYLLRRQDGRWTPPPSIL